MGKLMGNNCPNHYARWIPCRMCGSMVFTTAPVTTCDECKQIREKERSKRRWAKYQLKYDTDAYIVVRDPDEDYGYPCGAVISKLQLGFMLLESYECFTPGTILKNQAGKLFKVIKEKRKFKLITV